MGTYKRKTVDEYEIQSNHGQGFECVTTETTWKEAKAQVKCYRENEPNVQHRIVKKRVKLEEKIRVHKSCNHKVEVIKPEHNNENQDYEYECFHCDESLFNSETKLVDKDKVSK